MQEISSKIIKNLNESLSLFGHASLIVCGGSSPINVFKDLSKSEIDWSKITISLVDDRLVDSQHNDSNEKLVNDYLKTNKASSAKFISLCNESDLLLEIIRPFSVMLLGMGEDGHFASLFPDLINENPEYFDKKSTPKLIQTQPMGSPCHKRISMNLSMILQANNIYLLVPNQKKLEVLNNAKKDKGLPLYYLLNQDISRVQIIKEI
jgi:6-phosphogluconolactonase